MKLNEHCERILRTACERPVTMRQFTNGSSTTPISPRHIVHFFDEMLRAGFIYNPLGDQFFATPKGRAYLAQRDRIEAGIARHVGSGTYCGERWQIREGGESHKRWPSHGACGART